MISKEIKNDNELYVYYNGQLIYKRWLSLDYGKVIDRQVYSKYSDYSITDFDRSVTPELIIVRARLTLLTPEEGGREHGFKSGLRPNHVFEYKSNGHFLNTFIGDIQFEEMDMILPGETHEVIVRFSSFQPIDKYLNVSRVWWIHEGSQKIGEAEMLEINL